MISDLALVVSEVELPTFGGVDLVRLFKSHDALRHIPFVFLTTGASLFDESRLLAAGARRCLSKAQAPKTIVRLLDRLAAA